MSSFSRISIRFAADLKGFSSQMQNATREMKSVGQNFQKIGGALSVGVTLPILGIGAAAIKAASDAEETSGKFEVVFRDVAKAAQESADILRNSYGLSSTASQQLLGDTGDLLTGFGFSQAAALDLSTEVNKLAVDLASFTNFSGGAEGASAALTKALLGERESVKSLGISILEADVQARVLINTQQGLTFESERQAKAYATLQIAQEQSKNAIGDYARTNQSFANQMRLVQARIQDVSVQLGEILLPYVNKMVGVIGGLVDRFSNLDLSTKKVIVVVGLLAAAIGPLMVVLGTLATTIIPAVGTALTVLSGPVGLVIAAVAGLGILIYKNWEPIKKVLVDVINYFIDLYNESIVFRAGIEQIILGFKTLFNIVKLVVNAIVSGFSNGIKLVLGSVENLGKALKAVLTGDIASLPGIFKQQGELAAKNLGGLFSDLENDFQNFTDNMKTDFSAAVDAISNQRKKIVLKADVVIDQVKTNDLETPKPLGEGGRKKVESIQLPQVAGVVISPLAGLAASIPTEAELIKEELTTFSTDMVDVGTAINEAFSSAIANTAQFLGEFIGALATGNASVTDLFQGLLSIVGGFMETLGQALIAVGVASEAFKDAFASGFGAIAAGVALIALAGVVKSIFAGGVSGGGKRGVGVPALANGGLVYNPTLAYVGEYAGASSNPEVIAPLDKLKSLIMDVIPSGSSGTVKVVGVLKGIDMHIQNQRTTEYLKRRG